MKLSARNQLKGKVVSIDKGAVNGIVGIELKGGDVVSATISLSAIEELGLEVYAPFLGDAVTISGRSAVLIPSQSAAVSVEAEMEDVLRDFDAEYRQMRKAIIRTVVRRPQLMEPIIRTMQKARNYFKKLAAPYQI